MSTLSILVINILLTSFLLSHGIQSEPNLDSYNCHNATLNEGYEDTLSSLLGNLSIDSDTNKNGFLNYSVAGNSTIAYGSYLCRGDVTVDTCSFCVFLATTLVWEKCPTSKEGYFWYDECSLRYSDNKTVLSYLVEPQLYMYNPKSFSSNKDLEKLEDFIGTTMASEMASKAASDTKSGKKFATKELKLSSFLTLYSLVECTPDLTIDQCFHCINTAASQLIKAHAKGARLFRPSCNVRYELYPFYQINDPKVLHLLLTIECGVLTTTILVFSLFVLGCLRRCIHDTWQGVCIVLLYTLITIGIPYLIGLMRSVDFPFKLFPIWAFFLIFAYGGSDTLTAYNLSDNERSLGYYFRMMPLLFGATFLIGPSFTDIETYVNLVPLIVVYVLAIWNVMETMAAFTHASKSNGLPKLAARTYRYIRQLSDIKDSYLVDASVPPDIITIEQACKSKLLSARGDRSERLKDICLSHAYFNILLMRCADYPLHNISTQLSQMNIISLLTGNESMKEPSLEVNVRKLQETAFRIIEVELEFLFDFFYTKFFFLSKQRFVFKFIRLAGIAVCLWFAIYELTPGTRDQIMTSNSDEIQTSVRPGIIEIYGHNLEVGVTRAVIILLAILEAVQLYMRIFSNWSIVRLIFEYVRMPPTMKRYILEMVIVFISYVKDHVSQAWVLSYISKPWKRKLGQYSLLESYNHVPLRNYLSCVIGSFVKLPRKGQKESPAVLLSIQVKQAIVSSLANHGLVLSYGKTSLARNHLGDLCYLCELESDAHVILVWHIATCVCEHYSRPPQGSDDEHFHIATQLSKYCAYLLVFAPELLSAVPYETLTTFDETITVARDTFKGLNMEQLCVKLEGMNGEDNVFGKAATLANHLRNHVLNDPNTGWRVLSEFWVELLLYMTPTENANVHAEHLAKGGEFITLLWALLTHAGIVSRQCFQSSL